MYLQANSMKGMALSVNQIYHLQNSVDLGSDLVTR